MIDASLASHPAITSIASDDEERTILECASWISEHGLPDGELLYELSDPASNEPIAVFDLAWPSGLQQGLSQPVALLIDEPEDTLVAANRAGYRYFTSVDALRTYVEREVLALEPAAR